jgi:hypothetical protein
MFEIKAPYCTPKTGSLSGGRDGVQHATLPRPANNGAGAIGTTILAIGMLGILVGGTLRHQNRRKPR